MTWCGAGAEHAASLLALPALSALSSLTVASLEAPPLSSLGGCPASLRDLTLRGPGASCLLGTLRPAPQLTGVTRLCIEINSLAPLPGGLCLHVVGVIPSSTHCGARSRLYAFNFVKQAVGAAGATFAHLTRLDLTNCKVPRGLNRFTPTLRLAPLMPRLEVMECGGERYGGCGAAMTDHPALRELVLSLHEVDEDDDGGGDGDSNPIEWSSALRTLPRLADCSCGFTAAGMMRRT